MESLGEVELLLKAWAEWKFSGMSGKLGYPNEASFARLRYGGHNPGDNVPDVDTALRCMALDDAIVSVGGIHEGVLRLFYLWPGKGSVERIQQTYGITRSTAYCWLDNARALVWRVYCDKTKKAEKVDLGA